MFGILTQKKQCSKCKEWKPLSEFNKDKRQTYGVACQCRACKNESKRIQERIWRADPKNREANKKASKEWRKNNPDRQKELEKRWRANNIEKVREYVRKWKRAHPGPAKSTKKYVQKDNGAWAKANPEKASESARRYYAKYSEKERERQRKYYQANPGKVRVRITNRRARAMGNGGTLTVQDWKEILDKFGNKCLRCGRDDVKMTIDHVMPLALGGENSKENVQPLCRTCNSKKHIKHIDYRK
jgi:5-methylcytosine-specific restriction endonuclease McrA